MTELNTIWAQIAPYLSGLGLGSILSLIIGVVLKGGFKKTISTLNVGKIASEATDKAIEKIKDLAFTHDIAPLVEEKLVAATKAQAKVLQKQLAEMSAKYENVVEILKNLAVYFDGSMVSDEVKANLHASIDKAMAKEPVAEPVKAVVNVVEEDTRIDEPQKALTEYPETPKKKKSKAVR